MSEAQSILVVYGVAVLAYGFVLGIPLAAARMKAPAAQKHLVNAHLSAIIQGGVHLGLAYSLGFAELSAGWSVGAAWLLVVGSGLSMIGDTVNWLSKTDDQFSERSLGLKFNSLSGPTMIAGVLIVLVGIVRGL